MVFFFLCTISVVEVFSASSHLTYRSGNYLNPLVKHVGILFMGLFAMIITLNIKCKYFKLITPILLILSFVLLVLVLVVGTKANDANRWIGIGGIQFQPAEIAKGTMVLFTAQILSATQTENGADKRAFGWILTFCIPLIILI